jgi:predicted nucleic acid-binding protein
VLVAGLAAFKAGATPVHDSAKLIRDWLENDTFLWLINADILDEYKAVLGRLGVRPALIGTIVNLLREEAEVVKSKGSMGADPDPWDAPFWECAEHGRADFIVTLNPKDFPQSKLKAKVIAPGDALPSTAAPVKVTRARRTRKT